MSGPPVLIDDQGAVRLVTFNRPDVRNAFDLSLYRGTTAALREAVADDAIKAVVLTGAGSAFCAGQDLAEMAALATGTAPPGAEAGFPDLLEALQAFDKPLLAAVNGVGVGLGFTILGHCTLVLVADGARLRVPFAELGVAPEAASSYLLPLRMGHQRAVHALLTGDWVTAEQAVASGLALERHPDDELLPAALALAQRIAAAPLASLRAITGLVKDAQRDEVVEARRREEAAFAELLYAATTIDALDRATGARP